MSRVSMDEILHHARSGSEPVISSWNLLDRGKGPLLCMFVPPRLLKWTTLFPFSLVGGLEIQLPTQRH